ncbi:hypothetical protein BH10CYA1_BH10CYA1_54770 [soil metagenome]
MKSCFHVWSEDKIWTILRDDVIYAEFEDQSEALSHGRTLAKEARTDCILHESTIDLPEVGLHDDQGLAS